MYLHDAVKETGVVGGPSRLGLNWEGDDPCKDWSGILCDPSKTTVTSVTLSDENTPDYNSSCVMPKSITKLSGLKHLQLSL